MVVGQFAKIFVQLAGVVILGRLLRPEDFGLIAMVAVVVALGDLLRDFGMPTAALQARTLSKQQASNLFWANTLLGTGAALVVALSAPLIAMFYDEPRLLAIAPAMAIALMLNGAQAQIQVQLARTQRYSVLVVTDVLSQLLGLIFALALALSGAAYWALVAQILISAGSLLLMRVTFLRWKPNRFRRHAGSRPLFVAGAHLGLAQLLTYVAGNADTATIGARWGATDLGVYNRGFQLMSLPVAGLLAPLTSVVIPTLNAARNAGRSHFGLLLRIQFLVGTLSATVFAAVSVAAPVLIPTLMGQEWAHTARIFQILSIGGAVQALSFVSYWAFLIENQSKQLLYYNMLTKPLTAFLVVCGALVSIEGAAFAYAISLAISWPINLIWLARSAKLDGFAFARSGILILLCAGAGFALGAAVVELFEPSSALVGSLVGALFCVVVIIVSLAVLPGGGERRAWVLSAVVKLRRGSAS